MRQSINIDWEVLGAELVNLGSEEQGKFFKGMARELAHWPTDHQKELQAFYTADLLEEKDKKQLETFLACLYFKPAN